ncbi:pilus assembly PilX N-terminal domain-containing protein [uncultured Tolumonas sp.]|uniref:pilus assembly PilX N-terminal domain-containing protein n=1 Tax=uncultured Tolumonas sp. TaxID=263765 RepID=UPI002A0A60F9|nr:pilus assembly PilX N-terminal domain-containing protein [uncultured Tolumonas sp.]
MCRVHEQGMVLVMALILMLPLTLMEVSVMQWSREQMQMSAATSHRFNEIAEIDAGLQTVWLQSDVLQNIASLPVNSILTWTTSHNRYRLDVRYDAACGRTGQASSSNVLRRCRYADVSLQNSASPTAKIAAVTTLELPLISLSGFRQE